MDLATLARSTAPPPAIPAPQSTVPGTPRAASPAPHAVPAEGPAASAAPTQRSGTNLRALSIIAIVGGLVLAGIGFTGSYNALRDLSFDHHFGTFAYVFPVGLDAGIVVLLAMDLFLIRRDTPWPILRTLAHLLTAATIVFNASAAPGPVSADPIGTAMHAVIPLMFIASVEAARRLLIKAADIDAGRDSQGVPLARWLLSPGRSWAMYRRMRLWNVRSYQEAVQREQERTVYQVMLERRFGRGWHRKASSEALLPLTMARYGLTVRQALDLPLKARAEESERAHLEALVDVDEQAREEERQAELEKRRIRTQGDIERTQHEVYGATGAAAAEARAQRAEAEARAETRARVAAIEADAAKLADTAEAEERATEANARAAETRLREAEANKRAAETELRAAEEEERAAAMRERAADADRRAAEARETAEKAAERAAEAEQRAAETRARVAGIELRAIEMEDAARLSPRERAVRKVGRLALAQHGGIVEQLPLEDIAAMCGVSTTTASEYRKEAGDLIAGGYRLPE